jgi:DNA primase
VVLPVQHNGIATYVQLRTLGANRDFPKYLNSSASLGPNPRVGLYGPAPSMPQQPEWIVTEGIFDALAAAGAGYRAAAVLGAGYPDRSVAVRLSRLNGPIVFAFDADPAGEAGARHLVTLLAAERREVAKLSLPAGDLNDRAIASGDWPIELAARVDQTLHDLRHLPAALVHGPG